VTRVKAGAPLLVLLAALAVCGVAAARTPTPSQKAAILAAFRSKEGDVAIQKIRLSTTDPEYAILNWGFAAGGMTAYHTSLFAHSGRTWKVLWTRDVEDPANGACVYVPGPVARDLLGVTCPPPAKLRARAATPQERTLIGRGFRSSKLTPYAKSATSLSKVCVSNANPSWAGAVAAFPSGDSVYVFFHHAKRWAPAFESVLQQGTPPPSGVVLSLATCVGYDPAAF
jgi:hypothetical protein